MQTNGSDSVGSPDRRRRRCHPLFLVPPTSHGPAESRFMPSATGGLPPWFVDHAERIHRCHPPAHGATHLHTVPPTCTRGHPLHTVPPTCTRCHPLAHGATHFTRCLAPNLARRMCYTLRSGFCPATGSAGTAEIREGLSKDWSERVLNRIDVAIRQHFVAASTITSIARYQSMGVRRR